MKNKYIILSVIASVCILLITTIIIVINKQGSGKGTIETAPEQVTVVQSNTDETIYETEGQESTTYDSSEDLTRALAQIYKTIVDFGVKTGYYESSDVVADVGELSVYLLRASEIVNVDQIIQEDGESYMYNKPQDKLLLVQYRKDYAYTGGYDSLMRQLTAKYEAENTNTQPTTISDEDLITEKASIIEEASHGAVTVEFIKAHAKISPENAYYYVVDGLQTINQYYPQDSYILCESDQTPDGSELDGFLEFESDTRSIYR